MLLMSIFSLTHVLILVGLSQVDMDALMHMTDDDLKAMLIPMVSSMLNCYNIYYHFALYHQPVIFSVLFDL